MKTEVLVRSASMEWTLFAFLLFLVVFIGILIYTFSAGKKDLYKKMANFPNEGASS